MDLPTERLQREFDLRSKEAQDMMASIGRVLYKKFPSAPEDNPLDSPYFDYFPVLLEYGFIRLKDTDKEVNDAYFAWLIEELTKNERCS